MSAVQEIPVELLKQLVAEIQTNTVVDFSAKHGGVCPLCKSKRCRIVSSPGWVGAVKERAHLCPVCGHKFKSVQGE